MKPARRRLPVVQSDAVYEANYAVRKAMVDEDVDHLEAAISACGAGADGYGRHIVHDKLGIEQPREIYARRDAGVWSPPQPGCEERIFAQSVEVTTSSGVKYTANAVTIPEGRFAEAAVTRFPRRYEVQTARFSMADYRPHTPEQMRAAAERRRAKVLAELEAAERARTQLELPIGGNEA